MPDSDTQPLHVSLVAIPDAVISTLTGIYDVLNAFTHARPACDAIDPRGAALSGRDRGGASAAAWRSRAACRSTVQRSVADDRRDRHRHRAVGRCSGADGWRNGRYPELVDWLRACMPRRAPVLGLFGHLPACRDGALRRPGGDGALGLCPRLRSSVSRMCRSHPDRVLVVSGRARGADHLGRLDDVARSRALPDRAPRRRDGRADGGPLFALQWHHDGLAPYIVFEGRRDHGDAAIADAQDWLAAHFSVAQPARGDGPALGLAERTFKRRFTEATGFAPDRLCAAPAIEDAKRRLERTDASVDEISWQVGYEDPPSSAGSSSA